MHGNGNGVGVDGAHTRAPRGSLKRKGLGNSCWVGKIGR